MVHPQEQEEAARLLWNKEEGEEAARLVEKERRRKKRRRLREKRRQEEEEEAEEEEEQENSNEEASDEDEAFECEFCEYTTTKKYALNRHVVRVHAAGTAMKGKNAKWKCRYCEYTSHWKYALKRHVGKVHQVNVEKYRKESILGKRVRKKKTKMGKARGAKRGKKARTEAGFEREAGVGRSTGHLMHEHGAGDPTPTRDPLPLGQRAVVRHHHGRHLDALRLRHERRLSEVDPVARVILDDEQDAVGASRRPDGREDGIDGGGREHSAQDRAAQHAVADVAGVGRLVTAPAAAQQRDLASCTHRWGWVSQCVAGVHVHACPHRLVRPYRAGGGALRVCVLDLRVPDQPVHIESSS